MLSLYKYLKKYLAVIIVILLFLSLRTFSNLYIPTLMGDIIDKGVLKGNMLYVFKTGGLMIGVTLLSMVFMMSGTFLISKVGMGFGKDIRKIMFMKVESFSEYEMGKFGVGTLITRSTSDVNNVQAVTMSMFRMIVTGPLTLIGGILMAIYKAPSLVWILVFVIPILIFIVFYIGIKSSKLYTIMQKQTDKMNILIREKLDGIKVIRAFNKESFQNKKFANANKDLTTTVIEVNMLSAIMAPIMMLILNITTIVVVFIGAFEVSYGGIELGNLMAVIQYIMQIMFSFVMLSIFFMMIPKAQASAKRINEVLETKVQIEEEGDLKEIDLIKQIDLENVSFKYQTAQSEILKDINLKIKKGENVAIIGGTGSGKTTLVSLFSRFFDATNGCVKINGIDIKKFTRFSLNERISLVSQKSFIFTGSIKENIVYGNRNYTNEDLNEIIEVANLSEFISEKENRDFLLSQGGKNISGGQAQRINIARALLKKADVYIFDDSFSALDFKTEFEIRKAIKDRLASSTCIFITQRINSAKDADKIIVLDNGSIVGMGTHEALIKESSVYREIAKSQLSIKEV